MLSTKQNIVKRRNLNNVRQGCTLYAWCTVSDLSLYTLLYIFAKNAPTGHKRRLKDNGLDRFYVDLYCIYVIIGIYSCNMFENIAQTSIGSLYILLYAVQSIVQKKPRAFTRGILLFNLNSTVMTSTGRGSFWKDLRLQMYEKFYSLNIV